MQITSIYAHSTNSWLLVNGVVGVKEIDHPVADAFSAPDHTLVISPKVGETVKFKLQPEKLFTDVKAADLNVAWEITAANKTSGDPAAMNLAGLEPEHKFPTAGDFYLNISMRDKATGKIQAEESVSIRVGEANLPEPEISVFQSEKRLDPENDTFWVARQSRLELTVGNPDSQKYAYKWDLGDGKITGGEKVQADLSAAKLPMYIHLRIEDRQLNYVRDNYIRVDSKEGPAFKVVTPAIKIPASSPDVPLPTTGLSDPSENILVIITSLGFIFLAVTVFIIGLVLFGRARKANRVKIN